MLDAVLGLISLWWFFNNKYFGTWSGIKSGGEQFPIFITALTVLVYVAICAFGGIRWYYTHRRY